MAAFIVTTVRITDASSFRRYSDAIEGLNDRFGGEYLIRGSVSEVLEGDSDRDVRLVVLRFDDESSARSFIASDEYQAAKALRAGAAELTMRLVVSAG